MSEFTQGICADGAAILKDGVMLTPEEIIELLRQGDKLMGVAGPIDPIASIEAVGMVDIVNTGRGKHAIYTNLDPAFDLPAGRHKLYTQAPAVDGAVPNMFWDDNAPEESFAEDPRSFADAVSDDMTDYDDVFIVDVRCAKSLPNRKMKVWLEADGSGGHDVKWEWVE